MTTLVVPDSIRRALEIAQVDQAPLQIPHGPPLVRLNRCICKNSAQRSFVPFRLPPLCYGMSLISPATGPPKPGMDVFINFM